MTTPQQQFSELSQANLEKAIRLTNIAISGAERLFNLQLEIARDLLAENAATAKSLAGVKNVQDLMELQKSLSQPSVTKTMAVARTVYETASATQNELNKLVEEQLIDFNKNLLVSLDSAIAQAPASSAAISAIKSAVESATSAYGTVAKTTQRIASELAEATVSAVETSAKTATKSSARKSS
ncbi:MAG: phasin family protein [Formivibrio sp.]|nr:phasin family protein [Formivibrio sp.]